MAKYTEEQLLELKSEAHTPKPEILDAFNKLIEEVKESIEQHQQHQRNGTMAILILTNTVMKDHIITLIEEDNLKVLLVYQDQI